MALNQLAPVPGSLGGVTEALREAGKWRTGSGGSEFQSDTHRQPGQTRQKDLGSRGGHMGAPFSCSAAGDSPKAISQTTEFSSGGGGSLRPQYFHSHREPSERDGGDSETRDAERDGTATDGGPWSPQLTSHPPPRQHAGATETQSVSVREARV